MNDIVIKIDDSKHDVRCGQIHCRNNLINYKSDEWGCNLKIINIGQDGICEDFTLGEKEE